MYSYGALGVAAHGPTQSHTHPLEEISIVLTATVGMVAITFCALVAGARGPVPVCAAKGVERDSYRRTRYYSVFVRDRTAVLLPYMMCSRAIYYHLVFACQLLERRW